jgi:hypothetical protein
MDKRTIVLFVTLFSLIVLGMFVFAFLSKSEKTTSKESGPEIIETATPGYLDITRITAKHFYLDGKHTFVGEIEVPTPCDLVDVNGTVDGQAGESVLLNFIIINNSPDCEQRITSQRFLVEVNAPETVTILATFMGRSIELNLVPPTPGETPDSFELFIKG